VRPEADLLAIVPGDHAISSHFTACRHGPARRRVGERTWQGKTKPAGLQRFRISRETRQSIRNDVIGYGSHCESGPGSKPRRASGVGGLKGGISVLRKPESPAKN
jgi:hypothetical protein